MLFFEFPENASWNDKRDCVELSVILGPYEGTVRVPRRVFQGLLDQRPTPERCIEAFRLQRTRFEMIAERKAPDAPLRSSRHRRTDHTCRDGCGSYLGDIRC